MKNPLIARPIHPQAVPGERQAVRWVVRTGAQLNVGEVVKAPEPLGRMLSDGLITRALLETEGVWTWLRSGETWLNRGNAVREAILKALDFDGWEVTATPDLLGYVAADVIAGDFHDAGRALRVVEHDAAWMLLDLDERPGDTDFALAELLQRIEAAVRVRYPTLKRAAHMGDSVQARFLRLPDDNPATTRHIDGFRPPERPRPVVAKEDPKLSWSPPPRPPAPALPEAKPARSRPSRQATPVEPELWLDDATPAATVEHTFKPKPSAEPQPKPAADAQPARPAIPVTPPPRTPSWLSSPGPYASAPTRPATPRDRVKTTDDSLAWTDTTGPYDEPVEVAVPETETPARSSPSRDAAEAPQARAAHSKPARGAVFQPVPPPPSWGATEASSRTEPWPWAKPLRSARPPEPPAASPVSPDPRPFSPVEVSGGDQRRQQEARWQNATRDAQQQAENRSAEAAQAAIADARPRRAAW